jgi:uncharacterized protein (DUF1778 family)
MKAFAKKSKRTKRSSRASARVEARVSAEQKQFFARAAEMRGISFTDFVISSLQEASVQTIEDHSRMKLTADEQRTFINALLKPPAPNAALRKAAARLDQLAGR